MFITDPYHLICRSFVFAICVLFNNVVFSQSICPPNISFEEGTFANWQIGTGRVDTSGTVNFYYNYPMNGSHVLFGRDSANGKDYYGNFPLLCPNGSGYSIRLGNDNSGAAAEGISYTFTIPSTATEYSIIYNYAVVLQDPGHLSHQQPKFSAKVFDVTAGTYIECSSFDFVSSSSLPGFYQSARATDVYCKSWAAMTIDLVGYAGKTLRLEFTNNDCTLGAHFGYVYLDVNESCSSSVSGSNICPGDSSITLTAPFGFSEYRWFNADVTTRIGIGNPFTLSPLPPGNTTFAIEVIPYAGLGCKDTLYTTVQNVNDVIELNVLDTVKGCKGGIGADVASAIITSGTSPGLQFTYYVDSAASTFLGNPNNVSTEGIYYIKATTQNGCRKMDSVVVSLEDTPHIEIHDPPIAIYPDKVDITSSAITMGSVAGLQFSYWMNAIATNVLAQPNAVAQPGVYYIKGTSDIGCTNIKPVNVIIEPPPPYKIIAPNAFSPNGDGINDVFRVQVDGNMQPVMFSVYDRWGRMVYSNADITKPWDGTVNGKIISTGTYYWILEGNDTFWNKKVVNKGWITLLK